MLRLRLLFLVVGLVMIAALVGPNGGTAAAKKLAAPGDPKIYLPVVSKPIPYVPFNGRVTNNGAAVDGQKITIYYTTDSGAHYAPVAETMTASDGTYRFEQTPVVNATSWFYVYWKNTPDDPDYVNNPDYLYSFSCNDVTITNPDYTCEITIHDTFILSPADSEYPINLPVTFTWTKRQIPSPNYDNYLWVIYDGYTDERVDTHFNLGYVNLHTVNSLDPNLYEIYHLYNWEIDVVTPEGFGYGVLYHAINFGSYGSQGGLSSPAYSQAQGSAAASVWEQWMNTHPRNRK